MNHNNQRLVLTEILALEGVTEKDVQWWQSIGDGEKQKIKDTDAEYRLAFLTVYTQDMHLSKGVALLKTMRDFVFYDDYPLRQGVIDTMNGLGLSENNYPLPYELHDRIDEFLIKLLASGVARNDFQQQKNGFLTMNAFFRHKIKIGEI